MAAAQAAMPPKGSAMPPRQEVPCVGCGHPTSAKHGLCLRCVDLAAEHYKEFLVSERRGSEFVVVPSLERVEAGEMGEMCDQLVQDIKVKSADAWSKTEVAIVKLVLEFARKLVALISGRARS